jgi:ketosteroid isomerase-like protein
MTVESDKALTPLRWHRDSDSVFALLRELAYASMRRDAKFFERVLDDDYIGVGPDGVTRNKAEEIAEVSGLDSIKKFEFDDLRVSGNDDMAFATFLATVHNQANGQDSTAQYRYTINFIKTDKPLDAKVEAELNTLPLHTQESCLKCHSREMLYKLPMAKIKEKEAEMEKMMVKEIGMAMVKEKRPDEVEHKPDEAQYAIKYANLILQRQLKIAAIHVSRKQ